MSVLVFGVRLTLEIRPDFVGVRLALKNAHDEVKRASMVRRTAAAEHLGGLVPLLWATYCPKSDIHLPIDRKRTREGRPRVRRKSSARRWAGQRGLLRHHPP